MKFKFSVKKIIAVILFPAVLLTGCSNENTVNVSPSEVMEAVMEEISVTAAATKNESELEIYYKDIDISKVESAAFCVSVGHPDEIAIIKFKTAADAKSAEAAFKTHLEEQVKTYESYTPDEMYKLENAKIYSVGSYAVFLSVDDNDKAKTIADGKLAG